MIFQIGMGSRYPIMGETGMGMGFGIGAEYITRWGLGLYVSGGMLPKGDDNDFEGIQLEGGYGYKVGINYYLFPKNPLHLGVSASYGRSISTTTWNRTKKTSVRSSRSTATSSISSSRT